MRQVLRWMLVVVLCCATGAEAGEPDKRLQQAQTALNEAVALYQAGKYADAIARGEQALALREAVHGRSHAARVVALARRFGERVRERGVTRGAEPATSCATFEEWLGEARTCGVRAVETFAQGLEQDGDAVRAALTTPPEATFHMKCGRAT